MSEKKDNWDLVEEGAELFFEGQLEEAQKELEQVLLKDPANEHAYFFLGNVWFEKEEQPGKANRATFAEG